MKRKLWRENWHFAQGCPGIPRNVEPYSIPWYFGESSAPGGEISTFLFIDMCQIESSFICHRSHQKMLRDGDKIAHRKKINWQKNIFSRLGIPRIRQKSEKLFFSFLEEKYPKKNKWKWRRGAFDKLENAKIEIRLVPLKSNLYSSVLTLIRLGGGKVNAYQTSIFHPKHPILSQNSL